HRAVAEQRTSMSESDPIRRNSNRLCQVGHGHRNRAVPPATIAELAIVVGTPAADSAIREDGARVKLPGCNSNAVGQSGHGNRHQAALGTAVAKHATSPTAYRAILKYGTTVVGASRDRNCVRQVDDGPRLVADCSAVVTMLASGVVTPAACRAVA